MCAQCALYVVAGVGVVQSYYRMLHPRLLTYLGREVPAACSDQPPEARLVRAESASQDAYSASTGLKNPARPHSNPKPLS